MSVGVDLSIRTLYDQICAYAQFLQARRVGMDHSSSGYPNKSTFLKATNVTTFWIHALVTARTSIKSLRLSVASRLLQLDLGRISNSNEKALKQLYTPLSTHETLEKVQHTEYKTIKRKLYIFIWLHKNAQGDISRLGILAQGDVSSRISILAQGDVSRISILAQGDVSSRLGILAQG